MSSASWGRSALNSCKEGVEASLLLQAVHARRAGGFLLQGEMHALMAAVLLRLARLDALDGDAEPEPPDRELGEVEQGIGTGEGDAVVGADGPRQPAFGKSRSKAVNARSSRVEFESFAQQQEARGVVGDGERIAVASIAELELALEVGAPQIVGCAPADSGVPVARWRGLPGV